MIIAGTNKDIIETTFDRVNGKRIETGSMFVKIRLEKNSDPDDGKLWDGSAWISSIIIFPSGTHIGEGEWLYTLPGSATNGKEGGTIHFVFFDNLDKDIARVISGGGEHFIRAALPVVATDVRVYEFETL